MAMIKSETSTGFKFLIDDRIKTDWRLVKLYRKISNAETENEQVDACVSLIEFLFPDKGEALEKHIAEKNDGFIPSDAIMRELGEILNSDEDTKKS